MKADVCLVDRCYWMGWRADGSPPATVCPRCGSPIAKVDPRTGRFAALRADVARRVLDEEAR